MRYFNLHLLAEQLWLMFFSLGIRILSMCIGASIPVIALAVHDQVATAILGGVLVVLQGVHELITELAS